METGGRQTPGCCSVLAATLDLPCVFVNINLTHVPHGEAKGNLDLVLILTLTLFYALTPPDGFLDLASVVPFVFMPSDTVQILVATS